MAGPAIVDPFAQVSEAANQPAVVDPFSLGYEKPKGALVRGVAAASHGIAASAAGTGALVAEAAGAPAVSAAALDVSRAQSELAGKDAMRVEDVNSLGSGFDFLQYAMGYLGTQLTASAAGGGLGRILGGVGARAVGQAGAEMAAKHAGTVAGLAGTSLMQEVGQIYPEAIDQGVKDPMNRALIGGVVAAAADVAPELYLAKRVGLLGKTSRGAGALKEAVKVGAAEGATELFQTYIERAAAGQPTTGPEAISDYINSTVLGAFGGTIAGGVAGAYNKTRTAVEGPDSASPPPADIAASASNEAVGPGGDAAAGLTAFQNFDATGPAGEPTTTGALSIADPFQPIEAAVPDQVALGMKTSEPQPAAIGDQPATVTIGGLEVVPHEAASSAVQGPVAGFERSSSGLLIPVAARPSGFERTAADLIAERAKPATKIEVPVASGGKAREVVKTFDARAAREDAATKVSTFADEKIATLPFRSAKTAPTVVSAVKRAAETALKGSDGAAAKTAIEAETRKLLVGKVNKAEVDRVVGELSTALGEVRLQSKDATTSAPQTREFKSWFGESKVVDPNGQPLKVFHGTAKNFEAFATEHLGSNTHAPSAQLGFFFAGAPKTANYYALGGAPGHELHSFRRSERDHVFAASDLEFAKRDAEIMPSERAKANYQKAKANFNNVTGPNVMPVYLSMKNPLVHDMKGRLYRDQSFKNLILAAKAAGHDGLIIHRTYDAAERDIFDKLFSKSDTIYVAFDATQIKSAVGNDGTFDANDPSILSSRDATVEQVNTMLAHQGEAAIRQVEAILGTPDHLKVTTYLSDRGAGAIRLSHLKDVIELNLNAKDVLSVANHEAFHYLEHRVLPKADLDVVKRAFQPGTEMHASLIRAVQARDLANGTQLEAEVRGVPAEARAYAFQLWHNGELAAQGAVERIFRTLKRAIERIQNWVAGSGFTSYEDVFDAISRGYYARRYGSPFEGVKLDVPEQLQLASQDSLREMTARAKVGEITQVQINTRIAELLDNDEASGDLRHRFMDRTKEEARGAFGSVKRAYLSNISSGENLARQSAGYKNVFGALTAFAQRKNRLIADGVEKQLSKWVKVASEDDKGAVSKALLERTVNSFEAGSPQYDTIRNRLSPYQREMFDQANDMIGDRLEGEFRADQAIYARALGPDTEQFREWAANRRSQVDNLKKNGYFPERRYGDHVTHVFIEGSNGKRITLYYAQHEREADARLEETELKRALGAEPGVQVAYGYRYRADYDGSLSFQQFLDMASRHGIAVTQAEKERLAKALVSADSIRRNRIFHRKNIAGYSEDGMRVLAEFGVAMANKIAYHEMGGAINDAIAGRAVDVKFDREGRVAVTTNPNVDLWAQEGPMGGYFRNLSDQTADFVLSPRSGNRFSRALRATASVQFLGGSVAAGMVQLTSMAMNTTPWLTQYTGYTDALSRSFSGYKTAMANHKALTDLPTLLNEAVHIDGVDETEGLRHALQIAAQDGTTLDTEIYQIMGLSRGQEYSFSGNVQKAIKAWMTPFRITEQWNRTGTFIAAFKLAKDQNKTNDEAYKFAQETVYATQFRYDEANRPALARGDVGSLLFVFKTYPIFMLETMVHLAKVSPSAAVTMLLTLTVMAGVEGLPFAEDLEDLIDTIAQRVFNSPFNTKRALRNVLKSASEAVVGADLSGVFMHGVANELTGLSFASRLGMGNLIPGTRIGAADADYKRTMGEILGPVGTIVQGGLAGAGALSKGEFVEAFKLAGPLAGQNLIKGWEQWSRGYASDIGGRKLVDVGGFEAFFQSMGFSSAALNRAYEADRIDRQSVAFYKQAHESFMKDLMQGMRDGKADKVRETMESVVAWNQAHPDMPMVMSPEGVRRNLQQAGMPINQRTMMLMPRALRGGSEYVLGLEDR